MLRGLCMILLTVEKKKSGQLLMEGAKSVEEFYFGMCKLLRADSFNGIHLTRSCAKCSLFCIIEERWLRKRQDASFKFVLPQLIHTVKWKYNILFKQVKKN